MPPLQAHSLRCSPARLGDGLDEEEAEAPPARPKREPLLKMRRQAEPAADIEDDEEEDAPAPARRVAPKPRVEKQPNWAPITER